jgi:hypothetical protein
MQTSKSCSPLLTSAVIATPGFSRCRKREQRRSGRSGKEAVSPSPPPLRTARASFPACRSSRLTCRYTLGHSEDPQAQALDCPLTRRATVVRCHWWPYRSDRVSHGLPSCSSYSTGGKSAPFQVGSFHPCGRPYPSDYRRAFASSHILYPLGIGLPCGRLSRFNRPPMGFTVFRQPEMQTPSGPPLPRWRSVLSMSRRQTGPFSPHTLLVRACQPLWLFRLHEVYRGSPCDP